MAGATVVGELERLNCLEKFVAAKLELLAQPATPQLGLPYGRWEHLLAKILDDGGLGGSICVREALGGPLWAEAVPPQTTAQAIALAQQLLDEVTSYQDHADLITAPVTTQEAAELVRNWCRYHYMAHEAILDGLRSRTGHAPCPACRFEHCFWLKSETRGECSVCLASADGVLAPCSHPQRRACFDNLKWACSVPRALDTEPLPTPRIP